MTIGDQKLGSTHCAYHLSVSPSGANKVMKRLSVTHAHIHAQTGMKIKIMIEVQM